MFRIIIVLGLLWTTFQVAAQTNITYLPSSADFANPERGFYRYSETRSGSYSLLDQVTLEGYRQLHTPPTAGYAIYSTLVFRYFFLEDFKTSSITQAYLNNIQTDFNTARAAGIKLIPRFAYTDDVNDMGCSNWICPPYGDASKFWVLEHINQLAPILEANKDVIAAVQMGLIGVWGENYYTDFFGDASLPPAYKLLDEDWLDRIEVLEALLNAVPVERMVQVRYPQKKQRAVYGVNAPTDSAPLSLPEAFTEIDKARIGFHNDCLLASADDFGTYTDYGNSSSDSNSDTLNLKPYFAQDGKYVVVGGETCSDDYSPSNNCASSDPNAFGDLELDRMHYSYLNAQYNNTVNNDWETDGCMDNIKKRLGYRFELQDGQFSNTAQPGQVIDIDINLKNIGYASPYNERGLELILRNTATSDLWFASLPDDPRFWFADNLLHNISETICIPADMPTGSYEILLNLPDPMPDLYPTAAYSIRLANLLPDSSDPWESITGYNKLGHTIIIDNTSSNNPCNGEIVLTETSEILPIELLHLFARPNEEDITILWATSSEINNTGFHLERSIDSKTWSSIAWKDGIGTINTETEYVIIDSNVKDNFTYYYRLQQIDLDGRSSYSHIVSARVISNNSIFLNSFNYFPNPAFSNLNISWDDTPSEQVEISILNTLGQQVIPPKINPSQIDLSFLAPGVYFLKIRVGQNEFVKKLMKY